jgi:hypothetical protein
VSSSCWCGEPEGTTDADQHTDHQLRRHRPTALAVETLCGTAPDSLTAVTRAHRRLTTAAPVTNPLRTLIEAALDDGTDDKAIAAQFETAALAGLVGEQRRGSAQRIEAELLQEFCRRLDEQGAGDQVLDLLRKPFQAAAKTLREALQTVDIPDDAGSFIESATPAELTAWQSVRPAVATLDKVAAIARMLGPNGVFPLVPDPRATDPGLRPAGSMPGR